MKGSDINYSIVGYSVTEDVASGIISTISSFFVKIQKERERINQQVSRKREMQRLQHRDAIDQLPLEWKFRLRMPR